MTKRVVDKRFMDVTLGSVEFQKARHLCSSKETRVCLSMNQVTKSNFNMEMDTTQGKKPADHLL